MADTNRNIFSLSEYSDNTIAGEGIPVDSVYLTEGAPASAAYVTKGGTAAYPSQLKKADMSTDTFTSIPATFPGPAGSNRSSLGMGSTKDAVWYVAGWAYPGGGGGANGARNDYHKTPFATDTMTQVPGNLPSNRYDIGGTSNGANGAIYFYAGRTYNNGFGSDNEKLMTSTGTSYTLDGAFPESGGVGSVGGNGQNGYIMGMKNRDGETSKSMRFSYTTEYGNVLPGGSLAHNGYATTTNIGTANSQYISGYKGPGSPTRSYTQKLDYNTENTSLVPSAPLTDASTANGGIGNYTTHGYILGANTDSGEKSYIQKLLYSTDTISTIPAVLISNNAGEGRSGAENGVPAALPKVRWKDGAEVTPNDGYTISGGSPTVSNTDRLSMSTDSVERVPGMNSYISTWMVGTTAASSTTKGYYGGEYQGGRSSIWNIVYSTNGREHNPSLNLPFSIYYYNSAGNANKGYIMGGQSADVPWTGNFTTGSWVHRMTYSSDSTSRIPGANLPGGSSFPGGTGEGTSMFSSSGDESGAAYLTGGKQWPSQGNRSNIWKMSYATETTSTLPAKVPDTRTSAGAHSEKSAGYLTGGWIGPAGVTSVLKFPWSTETFVEDGGDEMHRVGASTGNQQYAYVMGGISNLPGGSGTSAIKKFEYSTSTSSQITGTLTGTPSNAPRQGAWGTGALTNNLPSVAPAPTATPTPTTVNVPNPSLSTEGYWSGGYAGGQNGTRSITDRLTFATDTTSRLPGSNCPSVKHWASGSSSATKGYSNGGYEGWESPRTSNIYSLTYASGTWATAATLGESRGKTASINSLLYSWTGGGGNSDPATYTSKIDRLTFATETPSKNILQSANPFQWATGVGNNLAGYFCNPKIDSQSGTTLVEKLTYSTDSIALTPGLHVSGTTSLGARVDSTMAIGTGDIGYIMGGRSPNRSTVNKITFATDTRTVGEPLWSAVHSGSGLSSPLAGYLTGQNPGTTSDAYKMPFASETWTYTGPANASPSSGQQKTGFGAGMNGNAFPEITPIL